MPINTLGHPAPGSVPASPCQPQNPIHAKPSPGPGHTFGGAQNPSRETSAFPKQWDAPWCRGHHPRRVASSQVAGPSPGHRGAPSSAPFQRDPAPKHAAGAHPRGPDSYKGMQALHSLTPILFSVEAGAFGRPWRPTGRIESPFLCFSKKFARRCKPRGRTPRFPVVLQRGRRRGAGDRVRPHSPVRCLHPRVDGRVLGPALCGKRCCKGANKLKHGEDGEGGAQGTASAGGNK